MNESFAGIVRDYLTKATNGYKIISVSQKPIGLGQNVCVGEIGRSHLSMFRQLLVGAEKAETKYIALAEHDCLYTPEHFSWIPPEKDVFYYNVNHWFVQWNNKLEGQYSHFRRKAMSQLVCGRKAFIEAVKDKIWMLENGAIIRKGQPGACEPGVCDNRKAFIAAVAKMKDLGKDSKKWKAEAFRTELPNIDIRHGGNFSGNRRARQRTYSIPYWGSFHKVMGKLPPGKWYQNITINGKDLPAVGPRCKYSKCYNKGKWETFIKPLLPEGDCFIEIGCNAGLYLVMAKDAGFSSVIGIENDLDAYRQAEYFKSYHNKDIKILHQNIGEDFDFAELPVSDVILLANVHYWIDGEVFRDFVNKAAKKTCYCIVVARKKSNIKYESPSELQHLRTYFKDWQELETISGVSLRKDPTPRRMYSVLFKSGLARYKMDELYYKQPFIKSRKFLPSFTEFNEKVFIGKPFDVTQTKFYDYWVWRKPRWRPERIAKDVRNWARLSRDVQINGLKTPLVVGKDGILTDGNHRLMTLKQLGYKYVICSKTEKRYNA